MMERKHVAYLVILMLVLISLGTSFSAISITTSGGSGSAPSTEAELEANLTDVNDVYTDNDFADNSANWNTAYGWGDHAIQNYLDLDLHTTDNLPEGVTNFYCDLARIQSECTNDFHNIGGTDDDIPESGDFAAAADLDADGSITDGVIDEADLDISNAAVDEYVLSYEADTANFEWIAAAGGSPGGNDGNVQYNNGGVFGGEDNLFWDDVSNELGIGTTSPTYALDVEGNVGFNEYIYHNGDTNTYHRFLTDNQIFYAGGLNMIECTEAGTDEVVINEGSSDINFRAESNLDSYGMFFDAGTGFLGLGTSSPDKMLEADGGDIQCDDLVLSDGDSTADIVLDTADGSDTDKINIGAGSVAGYTRGAYVILYGNENAGNGELILACGIDIIAQPSIRFLCAGSQKAYIGSTNGYMGVGDSAASYRVECPNTFGAGGSMRAFAFTPYSDIRCKDSIIEDLPENMVRSFCENVSTGIWLYAWKDCYQNETTGEIVIGDTNYSKLDFGIPAQYLFNWINDTGRFGQFAERLAHTIVFVPENESIDFWSVNYNAVHLLYNKYTAILNQDIIDLKAAATEEIGKNRFHIKSLENWAENFGYSPPPWD